MTSPFDPRKLPQADFRAPDIIGTVEGWRAWGVPVKAPRYGLLPKLYSVSFQQYYWSPRRVSEAECPTCGTNVPGEGCGCGFYSAKTLQHLISMKYHVYDADRMGMFHVIGRVANWGKVIPADWGWRAQKSYPVELFLPWEAAYLGPGLHQAYGAPVHLKNILSKRIGKELDSHGDR